LPERGAGVLVTRPEPGASDTAAQLAALGYMPVIAPLLAIETLPADLPTVASVQALLVTSGNAIDALPASHRHLPLFAVGDTTAARARHGGFDHVRSAEGDAHALAGLVRRSCRADAGPLLLATGRGQGMALAAALRAGGFTVIRREVYAAVPVAALPQAAAQALADGGLAAALFFSAETARHAVHLLRSARLHEAVRGLDALAIGKPAAVALEALPWRQILTASRPTQDAMLALLR
jgi:uroporphyrinogen-III synthase